MRHPQGTAEDLATEANRALELTRTHKVLIGVVVVGAVVIAGIGFAGSYTAVRELAVEKGFGSFAYVFPIGIDAGICVLLALDLLLTWLRIPFPLLRQTAWLLTAATIAFNSLSAWPDPVGVGMHAVIPVLFVVAVEAARHAIGRIADITADKHMEGVRLTRWLLSPVPTFLLWRRMKLWELRSYEQVIKLEQDRLVYETRLRARYGRSWRRKAPVESLMPLRLARYGVPLTETAPAGLAAAGIEPALLPASPEPNRPTDGATSQGVTAPPPAHHRELNPATVPLRTTQHVEEVDSLPSDRDEALDDDQQYSVFADYVATHGTLPTRDQLAAAVEEFYGPSEEGDAPVDIERFANRYAAEVQPEPVFEPELHERPQPLADIPTQPEPAAAAPARRSAPKRVDVKVGGGQPARTGRGSTRERVAEIYRALPEKTRALRGRSLATAIAVASGDTLKFETVRRSHISEALLDEYLRSAPQVPEPREGPECEG